MDQQNQPDNGLSGFANPNFVLINGNFWNCREKRRYIQGQAWLNEFTFILLQCTLKISQSPWRYECDKETGIWVKRPLEEFGSLEILKYIHKATENGIFGKNDSGCRLNFRNSINKVLDLRNRMTHEVGIWTRRNIDDTYIPFYLKQLLEEMMHASKNLSGHISGELLSHVNGFIEKCEEELGRMNGYQDLY